MAFNSPIGTISIFNCPECTGSNAPDEAVPGVYHIAAHDDAVEVAMNAKNNFQAYDPETHAVFKQIQDRADIITSLRNHGLSWGL